MPTAIPWKPAFLENLAETGLVSRAARYAGVTRQTAYNARNTRVSGRAGGRDRTGPALVEAQSFAQQWDAALELAADSAELEVRRRAMEGTERIHDVYRQGQKISTTTTRHYSDRLLMFLLEKLRPDTYGNRSLAHAPIPHANASTPCKHCGCDPSSQPSPAEIASRHIIDTYLDRLIAKSKTPPAQPAPIPPTPQPEFAQVNFDSTNQPLFVSNHLSSFQNFNDELNIKYCLSNVGDSFVEILDDVHVGAQGPAPQTPPSTYLANSDALTSPFFVSNNLSISIESPRIDTIRLFVDHSLTHSPNPPPFASSNLSSFQHTGCESKLEYCPSNPFNSFTEASTESSVGAQHVAPQPPLSHYLENEDLPNPPIFPSITQSSFRASYQYNHSSFDIRNSSFPPPSLGPPSPQFFPNSRDYW